MTAKDLNQYKTVLADKSYNVYSLEWKWIESDNDTYIGENIETNYQLNLSFLVSSYF